MKNLIATLVFSSIYLAVSAQSHTTEYRVSEDITVSQIKPNVYVHTSLAEFDGFGTVSCNGLIIIHDKYAYLVDTPSTEEQTKILREWIEDTLEAELYYFFATHWHGDCIGGLSYLNNSGVQTHSGSMTRDICKEKGLPMPHSAIGEDYSLNSNDFVLKAFYPGPGHSMDNIVIYLPYEKVMFGGCLVKDMRSKTLGNTEDGDVKAWPQSIRKLMNEFPEAEIVVPGHGMWGGQELLDHTLRLLKAGK